MLKQVFGTAIIFSTSAAFAGTVSTNGDDLIINTKGGLEVKTTNGDYRVKLGGRIQYDYNYAELNGKADEDTFDIRRARLYVAGDVKDWSYKVQYNVGDNNGGTPEDVYIRYNGWGKAAKITIGKQKEPFGLEALISSKDISFLERSAFSEAYAPGRNKGIQFSGAQGDVTYAIGAFDEGDSNADDDFALTARATYAPIHTDNSVVHFGVAYSDRANDVSMAGLELATASGPFHVQAEYFDAELGNTDLDGFYLEAGWVITGEQRPYKGGKFKRVKPNNNSGAIELVLRYEDGDGKHSDIELGTTDATAYGVGVNWYLNNVVKLGLNYTEGEDQLSNDEGSEFRARIQLAF